MQENYDNINAMLQDQSQSDPVRIRVIGVGGAGCNLASGLTLDGFGQVAIGGVDADSKSISECLAAEKILIGRSFTRGLGAGGDGVLGRKIMEEEIQGLSSFLEGVDLLFVLAGLGGGLGSGGAPIVAHCAKKTGTLVFSFVTMPFHFESQLRRQLAEDALVELRETCNAVIPLTNDLLLQHADDDATVLDCFATSNRWISRGVRSICGMLRESGLVSVDFADLRTAFSGQSGRTLFGLGSGEGPDPLRSALDDLLLCPLLHVPDSSRVADTLLVNFAGGPGMGMTAVNEVMKTLQERFNSKGNVVFGACVEENMGDRAEICVIGATHLESDPPNAEAAPESSSGSAEVRYTKEAAPEQMKPHDSKLRLAKNRPAIDRSQGEFNFVGQDNQRGYFDKTERNLYEGEDLDVPTYLRCGIKIVV
ncbi:MAG: cell division protein FtsZ [Opitutales bacterium]